MKIKVEYLDIGGAKQPAGLNPKYKWEVLDVAGSNHKYPNYDLNSGKPFPINDNTISAILCSMTLEHVHSSKILYVLGEMRRILVEHGLIRIVVPDIEIGIKWYLNSPENLKKDGVPHPMERYAPTKCGLLFSWILSDPPEKAYGRSGHQMMFDYETLLWYLSQVNFNNIKKRKFNECSDPFIGKDYSRYAEWALYVEAEK